MYDSHRKNLRVQNSPSVHCTVTLSTFPSCVWWCPRNKPDARPSASSKRAGWCTTRTRTTCASAPTGVWTPSRWWCTWTTRPVATTRRFRWATSCPSAARRRRLLRRLVAASRRTSLRAPPRRTGSSWRPSNACTTWVSHKFGYLWLFGCGFR